MPARAWDMGRRRQPRAGARRGVVILVGVYYTGLASFTFYTRFRSRVMRASRRAHLSLADLRMGAQFLWRLPAFLRHPVNLEEARATLRHRLAWRDADFLAIVKRAIYEHSGSPYRALLTFAGCEYGDLEKLVIQDGVEGALRTLLRQGVYLTVDEFKGRSPVVRGSATIAADPTRLRNPDSASHLQVQSSGSRGPGAVVGVDLAFVRDTNVNYGMALDARGGAAWHHAIWGVPGTAAMRQLLRFGDFGAPPVRWFSQIDPVAGGLHPRYRWSARLIRWGGLFAGIPLPGSVHAPIDDPLPIARWMAGVLRAGGTPHVLTFPSSAVRLCQAARAAGMDLQGGQLTIGGEPITAARLAEIRRTGMVAVPRYGSAEAVFIAYGCLAPEAPDDLHVFHDLHALIHTGLEVQVPGLPDTALFITSLRPTAPLVLLNVSLGDKAEMIRRACGCPLERLGWTTHLHTIRSYEKLTAGGMTFLDTDLVRVLEEVLPARFGGGPTDYQLVEEETEDGHPRLRLLVHPTVGALDTQAVAETFLTAISPGSGVERVMGLLWRDAGFLRVERRSPESTPGGKILHLRAASRPAAASPEAGR